MEQNNMKKATKSVTVWFNSIVAAVAIIVQIASTDPQAQAFLVTIFAKYPQAQELFVAVVAIVNILLRYKTSKPIETPARVKEEM